MSFFDENKRITLLDLVEGLLPVSTRYYL